MSLILMNGTYIILNVQGTLSLSRGFSLL